jgi:hypothetical protein
MCAPALSRRGFLQAGTGLFAAAAFGVAPDAASWAAPSSGTSGLDPRASRFVPTVPTRVADTRHAGHWNRLDRHRLRVHVAGHAGVPETASAVAVTVSTLGSGVVTVVPSSASADHPDTMLLDLGSTGPHSRTCFVALGDGSLDLLHDVQAGPITVDVTGWFEPSVATSAGRIVALPPVRVFDTAASADPFDAWEVRQVSTADTCPADAIAALITVGSTPAGTSSGPGHWTAFASDVPPATWSLTARSDGPTSAFVIVALDRGTFQLRADAAGHASVDVVGYVTGDGATTSTDGLFVPETPYRALDTRLIAQRVPAGSSREVTVGPPDCSALAMSVTVAETTAAGGVTVWGAGDARPISTSFDVTTAAPSTSFAVPTVGRRGVACSPVGTDAHVVVDVYGWFTGARSAGAEPVLGSQPYGIEGVDMEAHAAEWFDYGVSTEGRPLRAFRHGSGPRHGLITTGLHGDEHTGTSVLADLVTRDPVPGWTLWLVPIQNPDARSANRRYVHDVDMNRDFPVDWSALPSPTPSGCVTTRTGPAPFTLAESRQVAAAMTDGPFRHCELSISHHDNYNWVAPQRGSPDSLRSLADDYARTTGLRLPGQNGAIVPTSPRTTGVSGGFETFAHGLGMSSLLIENKAGYVGDGMCAGAFGLQPAAADVAPHHDALRSLLTDARLP